jgi:hypothetical protein
VKAAFATRRNNLIERFVRAAVRLPQNDARTAAFAQEAALHFIARFDLARHPAQPLPDLPFQASERLKS